MSGRNSRGGCSAAGAGGYRRPRRRMHSPRRLLAFILFTSACSPASLLPAFPVRGGNLNPLLQDPADFSTRRCCVHGYVGFLRWLARYRRAAERHPGQRAHRFTAS